MTTWKGLNYDRNRQENSSFADTEHLKMQAHMGNYMGTNGQTKRTENTPDSACTEPSGTHTAPLGLASTCSGSIHK